jgi:hypothetical protein
MQVGRIGGRQFRIDSEPPTEGEASCVFSRDEHVLRVGAPAFAPNSSPPALTEAGVREEKVIAERYSGY